MPDWIIPTLLLIGVLVILYRAFLHTPRAPPSGNDHEVGATNYWDSRGRFEPPD
ncbi:hypothetical protein [Rhodopseudomonas sp. RCAM05734]|uniref:hypothetical protein n=1 Tax=Rhodopseudomonas sp. RCAM05734 TaxID=3457549 RepID=UPI0040447AEE